MPEDSSLLSLWDHVNKVSAKHLLQFSALMHKVTNSVSSANDLNILNPRFLPPPATNLCNMPKFLANTLAHTEGQPITVPLPYLMHISESYLSLE